MARERRLDQSTETEPSFSARKPDGGRESTDHCFLGSDFRWRIFEPAAVAGYAATQLCRRITNKGRDRNTDIDGHKHLYWRNDHRGNPPTRQWWNERERPWKYRRQWHP